jgi:CRISPR-associated protein (TIGR03985 family)
MVFSDRPIPQLLQWLVRGSPLKNNLLRAIRLWVWLKTLYGEDSDRLPLDNPFTYPQWRDEFFTSTHPTGEAKPNLHDCACPCTKTAAQWLFEETDIGISKAEWRRSLKQQEAIDGTQLDHLLQSRLFGVTRRSLQADLKALAELGWLHRQGSSYWRVAEFPERPTTEADESSSTSVLELPLVNLDLEAIARDLAKPIGGHRRFFLYVDYIISNDAQDRVEDWQDRLKSLWEKKPIPPIQLIYHSARVGYPVDCIVYPICIYYVQRAVYLCAFGQDPKHQGQWYNFRLDKIARLVELDWSHPHIPEFIKSHYPNSLPTPEAIELKMSQTWGFDFYNPSEVLLLRFEQKFHQHYIHNTFRHETFQQISYREAETLIQKYASPSHKSKLLQVLQQRSHHDAYYRADYRRGDTNIGLRLRAWRPKGEVLLPWEVRQEMAQEVQEESRLYWD